MVIKKEFVLTHVVKDVSKLKEEFNCSNEEEHFGLTWKLGVNRVGEYFGFVLYLVKTRAPDWSVYCHQKMSIFSVTGKKLTYSAKHSYDKEDGRFTGFGFVRFINFDEMMKDYVVDDEIIIEVVVEIKKISGIEKEKLRSFDESTKEFLDVVLVVEDQKFYLSKLYLARHSSYFKSLLLGNFDESRKSEVVLTAIDVKDFQNFLEALHAEPAIDDTTITGILHLADMYDAQTVVKNCEKFLMESSEKSMKNKLELAVKYNLRKLKNHCLVNIKTVDDVRSVLTGNLSQMDPIILASLLRKTVSQESK